ncbi:MAG TPA: zinc ribbon domain-containing protein [Pyrinomonadaceae bacterium]|jgi:hypothetical protein
MKKCQTCGQENADTMRFCVECGATLPDAPIVVNFGGGGSGAGQTSPFGEPPPTQVSSGKGNFGNFPNQYSNVPPPPKRSNKKVYLIIGGILVLFLLVFIAGAAVIGYNLMKNDIVSNPTPTPASPTPTSSKSPNASPTKSTSPSPTSSSSPDDTPAKTSDASVDLGRVWVDYDVTEKGKNGMRVHIKFTVHKLKDTDSYLAIYFEKQNGDKLFTNNKEYRSKDGQVAVFKSLKPAYDDTVYEDAQLFIPYSEFNLDKGKYNLKMDIDVIYENGDLIQHVDYHEFEYTES